MLRQLISSPSIVMALFLAACQLPSNEIKNFSDNEGIVGGEESGSYPQVKTWVVGVRGVEVDGDTYYFNICTGAFIDDSIVVTAAHCMDDKKKKYEIVYSDKLIDLDAPKSEVEVIVPHPDYKASNMLSQLADHDIALLKIKGTKPTHIESLNLLSENISTNFKMLAAGYGRTTGVQDVSGSGQGSGVLRHVLVEALGMPADSNYFEVDQSSGRGVCNGDSGGPAIAEVDGKPTIVGVAKSIFKRSQMSILEAQKKNPNHDLCKERAAFMSIPYYLPWIVEETNKILSKTN